MGNVGTKFGRMCEKNVKSGAAASILIIHSKTFHNQSTSVFRTTFQNLEPTLPIMQLSTKGVTRLLLLPKTCEHTSVYKINKLVIVTL